MKIEKLNENQIRCILTAEDLEDREISISDFMTGSENARELLYDVLEQASDECDFDIQDKTVAIEAIPVSTGNLIMIMTKTEKSEDMNSRFKRHPFSAPASDGIKEDISDSNVYTASFRSLSDVMEFAHAIVPSYSGRSSLYRKSGKDPYQLFISKTENFDKMLMAAADFIKLEPVSEAAEAYLEEHFGAVIKDTAIQILEHM